jgi:hypothetical protein
VAVIDIVKPLHVSHLERGTIEDRQVGAEVRVRDVNVVQESFVGVNPHAAREIFAEAHVDPLLGQGRKIQVQQTTGPRIGRDVRNRQQQPGGPWSGEALLGVRRPIDRRTAAVMRQG